MYERFTDSARKLMQLSNQEAQKLNHEYIGTEHILLGICKFPMSEAASILADACGLNLDSIAVRVKEHVESGPDMVTMGKLPQTPRTKKVLEYAVEEARSLNQNHVDSGHILLALIREQEGIAGKVLNEFGIVGESLMRLRKLVCCSLPAVPEKRAKEHPPTVSQSFTGMSYERLGRMVQSLHKFAPQMLDGPADQLGRFLCCTAWMNNPQNADRP